MPALPPARAGPRIATDEPATPRHDGPPARGGPRRGHRPRARARRAAGGAVRGRARPRDCAPRRAAPAPSRPLPEPVSRGRSPRAGEPARHQHVARQRDDGADERPLPRQLQVAAHGRHRIDEQRRQMGRRVQADRPRRDGRDRALARSGRPLHRCRQRAVRRPAGRRISTMSRRSPTPSSRATAAGCAS